MLEPPSEPLLKLLLDLNLCSSSDLRRCRRRVRQLARDLPAFDSVWLDALVQNRKLTPFQVRLLESSDPQRVGLGPCVLVDRLGGGPAGDTYLARPREGHELCVLKSLVTSDPSLQTDASDRLAKLVSDLRGFRHPAIVAPHAWDRLGERLVLVSRYVPGPHLGELLVRRGRYPAAVVWEIGRQLADGLNTLAMRAVAHGDIRVANVRLTAGGVAVLVDAGVRPALDPELTIHAGLPPDRCDGIAPELIGTGRPPDVASDLYALGCLLWQLLAGRPPFPGGNPLGKLAAHQTRAIDDVRKWAPDTPAALAEGIRRCTARHANDRPHDFGEVLARWGVPRRAGRRQLVAFLRRFDSSSQAEPEDERTTSAATRWMFTAAALFAISGAAVTLADKGARTEVLSLATRWSQSLRRTAQKTDQKPGFSEKAGLLGTSHPASTQAAAAAGENQPAAEPLPAPDPQGVIHLDSPGPYQAAEIATDGPLLLRGRAGLAPQILVSDQACKMWAESVRLENVHFRRIPGSGAAAAPKALLAVQAQSLEIDGCSFQSPTSVVAAGPALNSGTSMIPSIYWKILNDRDPRGGKCVFTNSILIGDGPAIHLASAARMVDARNCLRIGRGPLFQLLDAPPPGKDLRFQLMAVTCRRSGALLQWSVPPSWKAKSPVSIEASDCVFDVAESTSALFEFVGPQVRNDWRTFVQMTGEGSVTGAASAIAAWIDTTQQKVHPLDEMQVEGLSTGPFEFAGPPTARRADSVISRYEGSRRSAEPPGIRN